MEEIQLNPNLQENKKTSAVGLIILIALCLVFIYLVGQKTHLSCTRSSENKVNCAINSVWMGSIAVSSREVSEVRNAYVESHYDDEEDSTTYRVVLRGKQGDVPVSRAFSSGNIEKNELANDINAFIKNQTITEVEFAYKSAGSIISAIVLGVFLALGIGRTITKSRKRAISA
jgi:hypothetical protein